MPSMTWKELFLSYDFLECILFLDFNFDFEGFYNRLNVLKHIKVKSVIIPAVALTKLKSDYHFVTAILE